MLEYELFISVQRKEVKSNSQPTFTVKEKLWKKGKLCFSKR